MRCALRQLARLIDEGALLDGDFEIHSAGLCVELFLADVLQGFLPKINSFWSTRPGFGLGQVTPMPCCPIALVASGTRVAPGNCAAKVVERCGHRGRHDVLPERFEYLLERAVVGVFLL